MNYQEYCKIHFGLEGVKRRLDVLETKQLHQTHDRCPACDDSGFSCNAGRGFVWPIVECLNCGVSYYHKEITTNGDS